MQLKTIHDRAIAQQRANLRAAAAAEGQQRMQAYKLQKALERQAMGRK